jgi:hypothetical protein
LNELNRLFRREESTDTKLQPDLEAAKAQRRICEMCQEKVYETRNKLYEHLRRKHYTTCWGCNGLFQSKEVERAHLMYAETEEEKMRTPCDNRDLMRDSENKYCLEYFARRYGHSLRPMVLQSNEHRPFFGKRPAWHSRSNPARDCCYHTELYGTIVVWH